MEMILPYVLIVLVALFFMPLIYGLWEVDEIELVIEVKNLKHPYYDLGMSFNKMETEEYIEEEFILGLFFITFIVIFYKEIE